MEYDGLSVTGFRAVGGIFGIWAVPFPLFQEFLIRKILDPIRVPHNNNQTPPYCYNWLNPWFVVFFENIFTLHDFSIQNVAHTKCVHYLFVFIIVEHALITCKMDKMNGNLPKPNGRPRICPIISFLYLQLCNQSHEKWTSYTIMIF